MATSCDAIVIGTGRAGPFLAQRLAGAGMKVAIIERKLFGGTCVNTGIPTKTMVASRLEVCCSRSAPGPVRRPQLSTSRPASDVTRKPPLRLTSPVLRSHEFRMPYLEDPQRHKRTLP